MRFTVVFVVCSERVLHSIDCKSVVLDTQFQVQCVNASIGLRHRVGRLEHGGWLVILSPRHLVLKPPPEGFAHTKF